MIHAQLITQIMNTNFVVGLWRPPRCRWCGVRT